MINHVHVGGDSGIFQDCLSYFGVLVYSDMRVALGIGGSHGTSRVMRRLGTLWHRGGWVYRWWSQDGYPELLWHTGILGHTG